jgi:hypothetical protein
MAKDYHCPACKNQVDRHATVCSNPICRASLAFCSHCRDITTYTLVEKGEGRFSRDRYRCDRCERIGVKCLTWVANGDCNGLARAPKIGEKGMGKTLCAGCSDRVGEVGRTVVSWSIIGAVGGLLKPKR